MSGDGPRTSEVPVTSFDEFFDAEYATVVRALRLALGDRARADDAAQEAFARALRHWKRVRAMDRPVAWVHVVGLNAARRWIKREERHATRAALAVPPADDPSPSPDVDTTVDVRRALDTLPPRQRAAVVLRYLADLSVEETARALRCAPGTVKSSVHAALRALRVELADSEEVP